MALRNVFGDIALESTANNTHVHLVAVDKNLMQDILKELKLINLHLSMVTDQELDERDLDQGD